MPASGWQPPRGARYPSRSSPARGWTPPEIGPGSLGGPGSRPLPAAPVGSPPAPPLTGRRRRFGMSVGRLVAVEVAVGALVGGGVWGGGFGWTAVGAGVLLLVVAVARRDGRWLVEPRRVVRATSWPDAGAVGDFGELTRIAPGLHVTGAESRTSGPVGIVGDGQGFAAGVEVDPGVLVRLDLAGLSAHVGADPARPAGLQVTVRDQHAESLAGGGPLTRRLLVLLRFEPVREPEVAAVRGGGVPGVHAGAVAAVDRLVRYFASLGATATPVVGTALRALVVEDGHDLPTMGIWSVPVDDAAGFGRVVEVSSAVPCRRSVVSFGVDLTEPARSRALVAVVGASAAAVARLRARLPGAVEPNDQAAAAPAVTLLGGGPQDLVDALAVSPLHPLWTHLCRRTTPVTSAATAARRSTPAHRSAVARRGSSGAGPLTVSPSRTDPGPAAGPAAANPAGE